ncbi:MAG: hypothetical protein ACLT4O_10600 [Clostridia bacterium]
MGIREAAHGLQTTKNPNPKRFFSDLGIHDPKGRSRKEHLDINHPSPRDIATLRPCDIATPHPRDIATPRPCDIATPHPRDHATPQIPPFASASENRPLKNQKTGFLEIVFKRNVGLSNICYTIKYEII